MCVYTYHIQILLSQEDYNLKYLFINIIKNNDKHMIKWYTSINVT